MAVLVQLVLCLLATSFATELRSLKVPKKKKAALVQQDVKSQIGVVTCLTSKNARQVPLADTAVARLLVPSLGRTAELQLYNYVLYVGIDDDDPVWTLPQAIAFLMIKGAEINMRIVVKKFRNPKNHIPMNEILKVAYDEGCTYFVRVNDDSEFVTDGWTSFGIAALQAFDPPNVGVVGPTCHEGNVAILTHDMTHRTHMDIFKGEYYADEFDNWWLDDWISKVYGPQRTRKLASWTVKHHTSAHGTRYEVTHHKQTFLAREISRGNRKLQTWLERRPEVPELENFPQHLDHFGWNFKKEETCYETYLRTMSKSNQDVLIMGKKIMMDPPSVRLLCKYLQPNFDVLEWGSGGSTAFYSQFVNSWNSVEHDPIWAAKVQEYVVAHLKNVVLHTSPVTSWSSDPVYGNDGTIKDFLSYIKLPEKWNKRFDLILIDGRARADCALSVLRANLLSANGVVVIHDWERRPYKQILNKYDLVEEDTSSSRHLGVLTPKQKKNQPARLDGFTITILTMNRVASLRRLLASLENAKYESDTISLVIKVDFSKNNKDVISLAKSFVFSHGPVQVHSESKNQGLRQSWLNAWFPETDTSLGIIFEDDVEVCSDWYLWLKGAWKAYGNRNDMAGISLQRQNLIPKKPPKIMEIVNSHTPFLYTLVGSIGFSPHPNRWREFLQWTATKNLEIFDAHVPGLVTSDWYRGNLKKGIWTQLFIWFCNNHHLKTLYINAPDGKTLASHWRERGEHFDGNQGRDFPLATSVNMTFPLTLAQYGWDGKKITSAHAKRVNGLRHAGSEYGGWTYNATNITSESIVYSVGIGEDVSWDVDLMKTHGLQVWGFDPTPKSFAYVQSNQALRHMFDGNHRRFHFKAEGISTKTGTQAFTKPRNSNHVSMRLGVHDNLGEVITVKVSTLERWMKQNGHFYLSILKMDVEGAEYDVLEDMIKRKWFPLDQLLVEFHQRFTHNMARHQAVLKGLQDNGFKIIHDANGQEISFQRQLVNKYAWDRQREPPEINLEADKVQSNTVVVTMSTDASELISNFVHYAPHAVVFCPERVSMPVGVRCTVASSMVAGKAQWGEDNFRTINAAKPALILKVLKAGYNVTWADRDVVFLKRPVFPKNDCDIFSSLDNGVMCSGSKDQSCAGVLHFRNTARTVKFVSEWESRSRLNVKENDQCHFQRLVTKNALAKVCHLDRKEFANGYTWVPEVCRSKCLSAKELKAATVVHANYLVGENAKISALKKAGYWYKDKSSRSLYLL